MKIHINKGQQARLKDNSNLYKSIQQFVVIDINQASQIKLRKAKYSFKKQQIASQRICVLLRFYKLYAFNIALSASMTAANKISTFSIVKNSCCDVIVSMKMLPFAKLFIEIIDNSQTKRARDLKILPDLEQGLKISIFAKGNILRCSLLQNDGSTPVKI